MTGRMVRGALVRGVCLWGGVFLAFLFLSSEDRLFKTWKQAQEQLLKAEGDMREWMRLNLHPEAAILIDIPELKTWDRPFKQAGLGDMRRSRYRKAMPDWAAFLIRLAPYAPMPRLVRLDPKNRFPKIPKPFPLDEAEARTLSSAGIKSFLLSRGVGYYLCSFTEFKLRTRSLGAAGLALLHGNNRLLLWAVRP